MKRPQVKTPTVKKTAISNTETAATSKCQLFGSMVFNDKGPVLAMTDSESKTGASGTNALLSLMSQDDLEGLRN